MSELTHEELTRLLDYDPETGVFRWKVDRGSKMKSGSVAGCRSSNGNAIGINKKIYSTRKIAWFYHYGYFPKNRLFIKNIDQYDDRINNIGMLPDKPKELTHEYLKQCIDYNPETGDFKWKVTLSRGKYGSDAFCISGRRSSYITLVTDFFGKNYSTKRLIVFWMTGYMPSPKRQVMTIDNNAMNLAWKNIKIGSASEVQYKKKNHGALGVKGVWWNKRENKFQSSIALMGKRKFLGYHTTEAEAHAAYMKAARKHYGALANDGYQHAMYEMEYEEVEQPVEPDLDDDIKVPAILDGKIEPVIHHADDF